MADENPIAALKQRVLEAAEAEVSAAAGTFPETPEAVEENTATEEAPEPAEADAEGEGTVAEADADDDSEPEADEQPALPDDLIDDAVRAGIPFREASKMTEAQLARAILNAEREARKAEKGEGKTEKPKEPDAPGFKPFIIDRQKYPDLDDSTVSLIEEMNKHNAEQFAALANTAGSIGKEARDAKQAALAHQTNLVIDEAFAGFDRADLFGKGPTHRATAEERERRSVVLAKAGELIERENATLKPGDRPKPLADVLAEAYRIAYGSTSRKTSPKVRSAQPGRREPVGTDRPANPDDAAKREIRAFLNKSRG